MHQIYYNLNYLFMNRLQESYRSMYLLVESFIESSDPAVLALMPNFDSEFQEFKVALEAVSSASEKQIYNRTGLRAQKETLQLEMVNLCLVIANRVRAYAYDTDDQFLYTRYDRQQSSLLKLSDTLCFDYCQMVHDETTNLLPLLTAYSITVDDLDDLQRAIDTFWEWVTKPRDAISDRRFSTLALANSLAVCAEKIKGMDIHMRMLETSHYEFYMQYTFRRKLITPGYRKLSLRGVVQSGLGELLSGVVVKIPMLNVEAITTDKGYFEFKHLPPGVYMTSYNLEGFESQTQPVAIVANERTDVSIDLGEGNSLRKSS